MVEKDLPQKIISLKIFPIQRSFHIPYIYSYPLLDIPYISLTLLTYMTEPTAHLRSEAIQSMLTYLIACGWQMDAFEYSFFKDPLTDHYHRIDTAFTIQTEREVMRAIENRVD